MCFPVYCAIQSETQKVCTTSDIDRVSFICATPASLEFAINWIMSFITV